MRQVTKTDLLPLAPYLWEIPKSFNPNMRVPARIFALEPLLDEIIGDRSLNQLVNVATLPGIVKAAMVMPDVHEGYGFPIGGVAATKYPGGVISPGGIGYDINCGVRLLTSATPFEIVEPHLQSLVKELNSLIPSGIGKGGNIHLSISNVEEVLNYGAEWAVLSGFGSTEELLYIENQGRLAAADPACVSEKAKIRGHNQLGTIGAGNHFVEVSRIDEIYHSAAAGAYGLVAGEVVVLIHTGSRGLGHQVATDHIRIMQSAMPGYEYRPPDRELACVPFDSPEGQHYFHAMCAAANFAWCNRQVISWEVRKAWNNILGEKGGQLKLLYDVAHNMAKVEDHLVDGKPNKLIVHRKGATRAFGPSFEELPEAFRPLGQPVIVPGSMGTESFVLAGTDQSMELSFGSSCHGAGRRLSRRAAKRAVNAPKLKKELQEEGIYLEAGSFRGIAEEAPIAYKNVGMVVDTVDQAGIAKKIARLKPLAVVKG